MNTPPPDPLDEAAARQATTAVGSVLGDDLGEPANAGRVESLLADMIPDLPTERRLLIAAYNAGATRELKNALSSSQPTDISDSLVKRLAGKHHSVTGARFAVTAWRHAIGSRNSGAAVSKRPGRRSRGVVFFLVGVASVGIATAVVLRLVPEEESDWYSEASVAVTGYSSEPAAADKPTELPAQQVEKPAAAQVAPEPQLVEPTVPPPVAHEAWRRAGVEDPPSLEHPAHRLTLNQNGYVSFERPSVSTFVLTSDAQPRPLPDVERIIRGPTKRTVYYRGAKCHISHGTTEDIWFSWFYETDGAWLVESHHASKARGDLAHRVFLYRLSDESWWVLDDDQTLPSTQYFLEGLSPTQGSSVIARVHSFVKRYHLADGGESYFTDFFSRSTPLATGDRPAAR